MSVLMENTPQPLVVGGQNLHVIKGPDPTSHFQHTEGTGTLLQDSAEMQSGNSVRQTTWFLQQTTREKMKNEKEI